MRFVTHAVLVATGFCIAVHFLLGIVTRGYAPAHPLQQVDTGGNSNHVLAATDARQAIWGTPALARTENPKVIVIGASVAKAGFRPDDLREFSPKFELHNFGVRAASPLHIVRLWHHVDRALPLSSRESTVVILGVVYGMLSTKYDDWVAAEEARLPALYWRSVSRRASIEHFRSLKLGSLRYFAIDHYLSELLKPSAAFVDSILAVTNNSYTAGNQQQALATWSFLMGWAPGIPSERLAELRELIATITASRMQLLVVSMPLPSWHRESSKYHAQFRTELPNMVRSFAASGADIRLLDASAAVLDSEFADSAHVSPAGAMRLMRYIYTVLEHRSRADLAE